MRENIGGIIALLAMALFIVAFIALIRPIKSIKLGSRKRAGIALGSSIVLFFVGASIIPPPTPEQQAARAAEESQRAEKRSQLQASEKKAADEASASELAEQKTAAVAAAKSLWNDVTIQVSSCDQAGKNVADYAGGNPSIYELYPMVVEADRICVDAAQRLGRLSVSDSIPSANRQKFKDALDTCENAYWSKAVAFEQMGKVLDGNTRPSAVNSASEAASRSQAGAMLCGLGFIDATNSAGFNLSEVMGEDFAGAS